MNYERTILEMLEHIKYLEDRVDNLESNSKNNKNIESNESGRIKSRNLILTILKDKANAYENFILKK